MLHYKLNDLIRCTSSFKIISQLIEKLIKYYFVKFSCTDAKNSNVQI